jgi:hypothetical protein
MSTVELSKELMLQQKTCWLFKRKIQEAMKSSEQQPLVWKMEVDEFGVTDFFWGLSKELG